MSIHEATDQPARVAMFSLFWEVDMCKSSAIIWLSGNLGRSVKSTSDVSDEEVAKLLPDLAAFAPSQHAQKIMAYYEKAHSKDIT